MVSIGDRLGGVVLLLAAVACTEKDSTTLPAESAGSGGSSLDAGASGAGGGGASAAGGSGGSGGSDMPEAGVARFQAVLDGEVVRLTALDPVWIEGCAGIGNPRLVQRSSDAGEAWTLLTDERPEGLNLQHGAHYLDGALQSDCSHSAGCDVGTCGTLEEIDDEYGRFQFRLVAREFVRTGELSAATCDVNEAGLGAEAGVDAGVRSVPAIESRAPTGPLGVRLVYYRDSRCQTPAITTDIAVE